MKPRCSFSGQLTTLTCFAVGLILSTAVWAQPPGYDEFPRTPGAAPFVPIADRPALEISVAPSGVLVLTRNDSGTTNDLDYYYGEDFSQKLSILQDRELLFNLSKKGYARSGGTPLGQTSNGETLFSFMDDLELKLLRIDPPQAPQGASFSIQDVTSDREFWSSDLFVTPNNDVLVMGYFISLDRTRFQPRAFR